MTDVELQQLLALIHRLEQQVSTVPDSVVDQLAVALTSASTLMWSERDSRSEGFSSTK